MKLRSGKLKQENSEGGREIVEKKVGEVIKKFPSQ